MPLRISDFTSEYNEHTLTQKHTMATCGKWHHARQGGQPSEDIPNEHTVIRSEARLNSHRSQ